LFKHGVFTHRVCSGLSFFALAFISGVVSAGVLVGNGAGLVEQNAIYAYHQVHPALQTCLDLPSICELDEEQRELVTRIQGVVHRFPASASLLQFVSESERPGFFSTGPKEHHRVAKTGNTPGDVIYFNLDMLYRADGEPALDLPGLIGLLVHELGHQAGESDHQKLDLVGSRVRRTLSMDMLRLDYRVFGQPMQITVLNHSSLFSRSEVYLRAGPEVLRITPTVEPLATCASASQLLLGWQISNLHWRSPVRIQGLRGTLELGAWLDVSCSENGILVSSSTRPIRVRFDLTAQTEMHGGDARQFAVKAFAEALP
jgi:hypothetical protein